MLYVLISPVTAESFNRGLMRLMRPTATRDASYVTDFYCPIIKHPTSGWWALELPETETVPIHLEADGSELRTVLEIFVQDEALTEAEANQITGAVTMVRGQQVRIRDFIPASWSAYVLTRAQAEAAGWFPDDDPI